MGKEEDRGVNRGQVLKALAFYDLKFKFHPVENSDCILKIAAEGF